ncbi:MAG TPA: hypothetical protein V6C58_03110 [Allocoleopsis sp.]
MILIVIILITVLILSIFAYQNWILVPPLVFLGMQSKSLPLALLILLAFGSGFVTIVLLQLLQEININQILASMAPETAKVTDDPQTQTQPQTVESPPINNTKYQNNTSDWEDDQKEEHPTSEDWQDVIDELESNPKNTEDVPKKPQSRPPSVYSYSYPQDKNSSIQKRTDRVYDADYRVIKPNYEQQQQQQKQQQTNNNDDWTVKNPTNQDDEWEF